MILLQQGNEVLAGEPSPLRYQIASVSKQFAAAAVLLLAQDGKLAPADPLDRWVPGWPGVTLHDLLAHTSGIGHWEDYPTIDLEKRVPLDELIETFRTVPPFFEPRTQWRYSSPGYVLAAHVVSLVADTPYQDFLADRIFTPCGMSQTFAGSPAAGTGNLTTGHDAAGATLPSWDMEVTGMGAGDVWSTATDMITWMDRLASGTILTEPWRTLMVTARAATGDQRPIFQDYGYGLYIGTWKGEPIISHTGHNAGFKAFAGFLPDSDRRLVILTDDEALDGAAILALLDELL
ncbi:serine hydrolase domain-containing protein [Actinoplanes sp. NPDC051494]|uniref:serine hydrolase domain-containing protein n=1 Tax=Actinoplanes sp. NPDC051494 TaxID=3363907 RepID=UPI0037B14815